MCTRQTSSESGDSGIRINGAPGLRSCYSTLIRRDAFVNFFFSSSSLNRPMGDVLRFSFLADSTSSST